jgi:acyl dehydratase
MAIDYEKLLNYPIPEIRQKYSKKDTAFYALSIGMGQDPCNARQLRHVAMGEDFAAMPSMAVVLGHPGFWLGKPETGVNAEQVLHGEQSIRLMRPLSTEGDVIGITRVTGLVDKGPGKGVLLYSKKMLSDAMSDEVIAETQSTTFLRADGGFGGPSGPVKPPVSLPQSEPDFSKDMVTRPEQALLYRLNGDLNPVHAMPDVARRAGFDRPILHGLCTFGVICHGLMEIFQSLHGGSIRSIEMRFTAPVFPGETIRVEAWKGGEFRAKCVERNQLVANHGLVAFF